ncbi:DUF6804 family protein [Rhizobium fabae]|uniref:Glucose-6-phosphate-specific signal transduction histidine kinase n=1 Tax=Rhizobium fabae TaxID=573179 RepID=A0A7W6BDA8_9HYPH|nr:DUF6804 family protein [Rhizobium fabae]MBB3917054.1 glucose-6-phosphate-specific signal transduction histidine kinase [Rhizobium fabae]RUM10571.1 hypothetical protein EFB14_22805 [Rhizobium fabae]
MRNNLILVPIALLIVAILPLPYGYYSFLRLAITLSAAYLAWEAYREKYAFNGWALILSMVALLFNPLIPVYLDRGSWFVIDLAVAGIFAMRWYVSAEGDSEENSRG